MDGIIDFPFLNRQGSDENPVIHLNPEFIHQADILDEDLVKRKEVSKAKQELFSELPFHSEDLFTVTCPICMMEKDLLFQLTCTDHYCISCTILFLTNLISSGRVFPNELTCPLCSAQVPDHDIRIYIGEGLYAKMLEFREKFTTDRLVAAGKALYCPISHCSGYVHLINGKQAEACAVCRATLCPECLTVSHPQLTCEEYASLIMGNDREIEELLLSKSWKKCPFCTSLVEKVDGCQFVRCQSVVCRGQENALCYLCGKKLREKHHHKHFKFKGPFGDTCNTLDGIEDLPFEDGVVENPDILPNEGDHMDLVGYDDYW